MSTTYKDLAEKITEWAQEKKAEDITFFDVHGKTDYTDGIIICHGTADLHVKAIAENIVDKAHEEKIQILSVEGMDNAAWVLIDMIDIIVHVFSEEVRGYYQLEDLFTIKSKKELESEHVEKQD
jgi:ribosome-associated protein